MGVRQTIAGATFAGPISVTEESFLPTQGALLLIDPTYPGQEWAAGVPASGAAITNIVAGQLAAASGSAAVAPSFTRDASFTGTVGRVERSAKGGLHGIQTVANTTSLVGAYISAAASIGSFMAAHPTHSYYVSAWVRPTVVGDTSWFNSKYEIRSQVPPEFAAVDTQLLGLTTAGSVMQGALANGAVRRYAQAGTPLSSNFVSTSSRAVLGFLMGNSGYYGNGNGGGNKGRQGSLIHYRLYVEDLTVSGRTWDAVNSLEGALFDRVCLTIGGRYYGDTTSPVIGTALPASAAAGATVTLTGSSLAAVTTVTMGGVTAAIVGTPSATSMQITVPAGTAGSAPIIASTPALASVPAPYTRT